MGFLGVPKSTFNLVKLCDIELGLHDAVEVGNFRAHFRFLFTEAGIVQAKVSPSGRESL